MPNSTFYITPLPLLENNTDFLKKINKEFNVTTENWDSSLLSVICKHGKYKHIKSIYTVNKNILDKFKDKITPTLLSNLYLSSQDTYDKSFAREIEKYGQVKILIMLPTGKIVYKNLSDNRVMEIEIHSTVTNLDLVRANWCTYTEALANLCSYYKGNPPIIRHMKKSFISLIKLVESDKCFTKLFFDYSKIIESIDLKILEEINSKKNFFSTSIMLSQHLTQFFIQINNLQNAESFLAITNSMLNDIQNKKTTISLDDQKYSSLEKYIKNQKWASAMVNIHKGDNNKSTLKYLIELYKDDPTDKECIERLHNTYYNTGEYNKARGLIKEHPDLFSYMSMVDEIIINSQYPALKDIKKLSYYNMATVVILALKKAITDNDTEWTEYYRNIAATNILNNHLSFHTMNNTSQITIKLLYSSENIYDKKIYEQLLKIPNTERFNLLYDMSFIYANPTTYEVAKKCVEIALQFDLDNCVLLRQKEILTQAITINQLKHPLKESILPSCERVEEKSVVEPIASNSWTESRETLDVSAEVSNEDILLQSYDSIIATNDPKKIHKYFQDTKREMCNKLILNFKKTNNEAGWLIDQDIPIKIKLSSTTRIEYSLYTAIDPRLEEKCEESLLQKWKDTLMKGLVSKCGTSGIKYLHKKLYEVKIVSIDSRLVSSKIYINSENTKLMLFDKEISHKKIGQYISSNQHKEIRCPNYYENVDATLLGGNYNEHDMYGSVNI